jgi:putative membrane protein insertion efficiency factor
MRKIALKFLDFYQKFLTVFAFGSCRYYPTCSEYAKWQFEKNNIFLAFFYTFFRILRCNQLFKGGIDYPVIKIDKKSKKNFICKDNQNTIIVKFWLVKKEKDKYFLIKSF